MITLKEFLSRLGDEQAAALIGVTPRAVAAWRRGERFPRPAQAAHIIQIAKHHPAGPLSYSGIYQRIPTDQQAA